MKCTGIIGWLFGHKYKPVFDIDTEEYSASEKEKIIINATNHNFWNYDFTNETNINTNNLLNKPKRTTKVYVGSVCERCGDKIDTKSTI